MKKALDVMTLLAAIVGLITAFFCLPVTYICGAIIILDILFGLNNPEGWSFFLFALVFAVIAAITALIKSVSVFAAICIALCIMVVLFQIVGLFQYIKRS